MQQCFQKIRTKIKKNIRSIESEKQEKKPTNNITKTTKVFKKNYSQNGNIDSTTNQQSNLDNKLSQQQHHLVFARSALHEHNNRMPTNKTDQNSSLQNKHFIKKNRIFQICYNYQFRFNTNNR